MVFVQQIGTEANKNITGATELNFSEAGPHEFCPT